MAGRGCSRHEEDEEDEEHDRSCGEDHCGGQHHTKSAHATHGSGMPSSSSSASGPMRPGAHLSRDEKRGLGSWAGSGPTLHLGPRPACCKCKERPATVVVRQREPVCSECLESNVLNKIRVIKTKGALVAGDRVLMAVSGGPASLVALYGLMLMQVEAGLRAGKGTLPFEMVAVHIQEGAALGGDEGCAERHAQEVTAAVASTGFSGRLELVPLQDVYEEAAGPAGAEQGGEPAGGAGKAARLARLLQAATDPTGREDLVRHLRLMLLHKLASGPLRCNKIMTGDSSTLLAVRVIAETAKGRGFALAGSLQLLDCRHGPSAPSHVLPLREVTTKEAVCLCRARGFSVAPPLELQLQLGLGGAAKGGGGGAGSGTHGSSVNLLSEAFVEGLQANLPSTISTILRTALNLQPFAWNETPLEAHYRQLRHKGGAVQQGTDARAPPGQQQGGGDVQQGRDDVQQGRGDVQQGADPTGQQQAQELRQTGVVQQGADSRASPGQQREQHEQEERGSSGQPSDAMTSTQPGEPPSAPSASQPQGLPLDLLCVLCSSPLTPAEVDAARRHAGAAGATGVQGEAPRQQEPAGARGAAAAGAQQAESRSAAQQPVERPALLPLESGCCASCRQQIVGPLRRHVQAAGTGAGGASEGSAGAASAAQSADGQSEVGLQEAQVPQDAALRLLPELVGRRLAQLSKHLTLT